MTKVSLLMLALIICLSYISCVSCGGDSSEGTDKKTINLTIYGTLSFDTLSQSIPEEDESRLISRSDITSPAPIPLDSFFKMDSIALNYKNIDSDSLKDVAIMALITDSSTPDNPELPGSNFIENIMSWAMVEESGNFTITADLDESESFIIWIFLPFYDFTAELSSKFNRNVKGAQTDSDRIGILIKVSDLNGTTVIGGGSSDDTIELDDIEISLDENGNLAGTTQTSLSGSVSLVDVSIDQINLSLGIISIVFGEAIEQNTLTTSSFDVTNSNGESQCESVDYDEDNLISTCRITPPDCEELDNYTLTVKGVTDLDGNLLPKFNYTFSTADDYFDGNEVADCWDWMTARDPLEMFSVEDGAMAYSPAAQNGDHVILAKILKDNSYSVGIHVSNSDFSNINQDPFIAFSLTNSLGDANVAILITRDYEANPAFNVMYDEGNGGGVPQGAFVALAMTELYLCLIRDVNSVQAFYSTDGNTYTELSVPAHTLQDAASSTFYINFVDSSTEIVNWTPTFSAIKFLNFNQGDDYTCPTF